MAASSGNDVGCSHSVERSQSILGRDLNLFGQFVVQSTKGNRFVWTESHDVRSESVERVEVMRFVRAPPDFAKAVISIWLPFMPVARRVSLGCLTQCQGAMCQMVGCRQQARTVRGLDCSHDVHEQGDVVSVQAAFGVRTWAAGQVAR
jgi:hypothetical protein